MPSASYIAAVRASIVLTCSAQTLIDLTTQRSNEVGSAEPPEAAVVADFDVLEQAIELAGAEIEDILGVGVAAASLHVKYTAELTIAELATTHAVNVNDIGISHKSDILARARSAAKRAVLREARIEQGDRTTGYKAPPSGNSPFEDLE